MGGKFADLPPRRALLVLNLGRGIATLFLLAGNMEEEVVGRARGTRDTTRETEGFVALGCLVFRAIV